jgi:hypothetical protein
MCSSDYSVKLVSSSDECFLEEGCVYQENLPIGIDNSSEASVANSHKKLYPTKRILN